MSRARSNNSSSCFRRAFSSSGGGHTKFVRSLMSSSFWQMYCPRPISSIFCRRLPRDHARCGSLQLPSATAKAKQLKEPRTVEEHEHRPGRRRHEEKAAVAENIRPDLARTIEAPDVLNRLVEDRRATAVQRGQVAETKLSCWAQSAERWMDSQVRAGVIDGLVKRWSRA
jgi:hypothetical protein